MSHIMSDEPTSRCVTRSSKKITEGEQPQGGLAQLGIAQPVSCHLNLVEVNNAKTHDSKTCGHGHGSHSKSGGSCGG